MSQDAWRRGEESLLHHKRFGQIQLSLKSSTSFKRSWLLFSLKKKRLQKPTFCAFKTQRGCIKMQLTEEKQAWPSKGGGGGGGAGGGGGGGGEGGGDLFFFHALSSTHCCCCCCCCCNYSFFFAAKAWPDPFSTQVALAKKNGLKCIARGFNCAWNPPHLSCFFSAFFVLSQKVGKRVLKAHFFNRDIKN